MIARSCYSTLGLRRFTGNRSAAWQSYVAIRNEGLFDLAFFCTACGAFSTHFARLCKTVKSCRCSAPEAHSGIRNRSCFAVNSELRFFRLYLLLAYDMSTHSSSEALGAAWLQGRIGGSVADVRQELGADDLIPIVAS